MERYHDERIKEFEESVRTDPYWTRDDNLMNELGEMSPLSDDRRQREDWRAWRRVVVRECLRRGLISEDPGGAP